MGHLRHALVLGLAGSVGLCGAASFEADLHVQYGAHVDNSAPRTTMRGLQLNAQYEAEGPVFRWRAAGRLRWNEAYRQPIYSDEARRAYRLSADWRELSVATHLRDWRIIAGLQQEVWGRADNLRVVDTVNPLDLRDFVLPDLNEYRVAVPMLRAERRFGPWSVSLLYLPWFLPNRSARPGSEYAFNAAAGLAVTWLPDKKPARRLRSGEMGVQLSRSFQGLDVSGFLLATRDDEPVYRRVDLGPGGGLALQGEYHRQLMLGLSLARSLENGLIFRSEWAWVPDAVRMVNRVDTDGLVQSARLTGLIGLDYAWRDWLFSAQATDRYIRGWRSGDPQPKHAALYTLAASGNSLSARLETRLSVSRYAAHHDGMLVQLKSTWKSDDHTAYALGADLFSGEPQGVFGQFKGKSRLTLEAIYRF